MLQLAEIERFTPQPFSCCKLQGDKVCFALEQRLQLGSFARLFQSRWVRAFDEIDSPAANGDGGVFGGYKMSLDCSVEVATSDPSTNNRIGVPSYVPTT